jgi:hypothetical protein
MVGGSITPCFQFRCNRTTVAKQIVAFTYLCTYGHIN